MDGKWNGIYLYWGRTRILCKSDDNVLYSLASFLQSSRSEVESKSGPIGPARDRFGPRGQPRSLALIVGPLTTSGFHTLLVPGQWGTGASIAPLLPMVQLAVINMQRAGAGAGISLSLT
jgi:hypothetical protein